MGTAGSVSVIPVATGNGVIHFYHPQRRSAYTMKLVYETIFCKTGSGTDIIDITPAVQAKIPPSGITDGSVLLFVAGSTAALTTIEYEPGAVADLRDAIERLAPAGQSYRHDQRWGDGNGYAHVRAALLGPSLTIPLSGGRMLLGTWQQIVVLDFDNRPRTREIQVQITGV
jgi:secondary thiamine-phosphate synthase enzyme